MMDGGLSVSAVRRVVLNISWAFIPFLLAFLRYYRITYINSEQDDWTPFLLLPDT
jgi:hypothetical protein